MVVNNHLLRPAISRGVGIEALGWVSQFLPGDVLNKSWVADLVVWTTEGWSFFKQLLQKGVCGCWLVASSRPRWPETSYSQVIQAVTFWSLSWRSRFAFERVTFLPSQRGRQQNCQESVVLDSFGKKTLTWKISTTWILKTEKLMERCYFCSRYHFTPTMENENKTIKSPFVQENLVRYILGFFSPSIKESQNIWTFGTASRAVGSFERLGLDWTDASAARLFKRRLWGVWRWKKKEVAAGFGYSDVVVWT